MNSTTNQSSTNFPVHPDYDFLEKIIISPDHSFDRVEYLHEYANEYDFYDSFKRILNLCNNDRTVLQDLRIDRMKIQKTDDQIWDDLKMLNCQPNALIDRLIQLTKFGLKNFPLIIGYFEDLPVVVEPGVRDLFEVRWLNIGEHPPLTCVAHQNPQFRI